MRVVALFTLAVGCGSEQPGWPVRTTLEDGQVAVGEVSTDVLVLDSGAGALEIPLADVGEIVPVEGAGLDEAHGYVGVWLRNGSELRGRWDEPQLAMELEIGGERVSADIPTDRLVRLQTQGGQEWPSDVYRVRTAWGDDFLVDPEETTLTIASDLGRFSPTLAECATVAPVGDADGDWRIELHTGTVLIGPLDGDSIAFALPLGPEKIEVPLDQLVAMQAQQWMQQDFRSTATDASAGDVDHARAAPSPGGGDAGGGWFSNSAFQAVKTQQDVEYERR